MSDDATTIQAIQNLGTTVLARLDSQDKSAAERDKKLDGLVARVDKLEERIGSPTDPPTAAVARAASTAASNASMETAALEGRVIALDAKVTTVAADLAKNNALTTEIRDAIVKPLGAILSAKPVQAAAMAVLLAALGAAGAMLQNKVTGPLVAPQTITDGGTR